MALKDLEQRRKYMLEYGRKWYAKNRSRIRKQHRERYWLRHDRELERQRSWRAKNRETLREKQRAYYRRLNPEDRKARRRGSLMRSYGISGVDYKMLLAQQHGVCAICKEPPSGKRPLFVDHCHRSKKARGLLCGRCNSAIGYIRENMVIWRNICNYLWTPECSEESLFKNAVLIPMKARKAA